MMGRKLTVIAISIALALGLWGAPPVEYAWAATCNWTGTVSSDWAAAGNWDCGAVPGTSDTAVIGPATNNPVISANTTVGTVTINAGGFLTYAGGAGVTLTITTFNINDGGTYVHNRAAVLPLTATNRNFTVNSTVEIQSFSAPASALPAFGNLTVNSTATVQMSGFLATVNGNLTKLNTGEFRLAVAQGVNLTVGNNLDILNGTLTLQSSATTNSVSVAINGNLSINSGAILQSGSGTGVHQFVIRGNWANNGTMTLNAAVGTGVTFNGTSEQTVSGTSATAFHNLLVASNAKVLLPVSSTATVLTNNGTITQTQTVNGNTDVTFVGIGGYGGVVLNANGSDLGSTIVAIKGNQACNAGDQLIHRCFNIIPTNATGRNATITFSFIDSELNGNSCAAMDAYHWNGLSWEGPLAVGTRDCVSTPRTFQITNVATFSPFGLKSGASPTAVALAVLKADSTQQPVPLLFPLLALALMIIGAMRYFRRRSRAA